jgi:hypothetical protein
MVVGLDRLVLGSRLPGTVGMEFGSWRRKEKGYQKMEPDLRFCLWEKRISADWRRDAEIGSYGERR